jgi:hypothetical protein
VKSALSQPAVSECREIFLCRRVTSGSLMVGYKLAKPGECNFVAAAAINKICANRMQMQRLVHAVNLTRSGPLLPYTEIRGHFLFALN